MSKPSAYESVIPVTLTVGVDVLIGTLTPLTVQHIALKSEQAHPMPDKKEYEKPIENALPGTTAMRPADENPDYIIAVNDVLQARARFIMDNVFDLVVVGGVDEAETVKRYADRLRKGRRNDTLVINEGDTDFEIILRNFLLMDMRDVEIILKVAQLRAPLSASEVADGRALFRVDTERQARRTSPIRSIAPRTERVPPGIAEPSSDRDSDSA